MRIEKKKAQEIIRNWGYKRLPKSGRQYLRVGCGVVRVVENCLGKYYYGWVNDNKGSVNLLDIVGLVYLGILLIVLLSIF